MKFLFFLVFSPVIAFTQQKKDSKIIVAVTDTANLFNRVAALLYEQGYTLEQKDNAVGFMATAEKPVPKSSSSIKIRAMIKDSTVMLTGVHAWNVEMELFGTKMTRTFDPVKFVGLKGSVDRAAWNELHSIADRIGGAITYAK